MKFLVVLMLIFAVAVAQHAHFCNDHSSCHCNHGTTGQCINNLCDCNQSTTASPVTTMAPATTPAPTAAPTTAAPPSGCQNHCHEYPCEHGHGHCDHALNTCKCH